MKLWIVPTYIILRRLFIATALAGIDDFIVFTKHLKTCDFAMQIEPGKILLYGRYTTI